MSFTFKHPKYYTELRKLRNKSDQAISLTLADGCNGSVRPGPGPKQQASSFKPQASSSMILEPRKSFPVHGSRVWTMIKVLCGCLI